MTAKHTLVSAFLKITSPYLYHDNCDSGIFPPLLKSLHEAHILTEDLALPDDVGTEEAVYRGLCRLPGVTGARRRRIDILTVPWKSRGAALLYYTVSRFIPADTDH